MFMRNFVVLIIHLDDGRYTGVPLLCPQETGSFGLRVSGIPELGWEETEG